MKYIPTSKEHIKFSGHLLSLLKKANFLKRPERLELILDEVKRLLPRTNSPSNYPHRFVPRSPAQLADQIIQEELDKAVTQFEYHLDGSKRILDDNGEVI